MLLTAIAMAVPCEVFDVDVVEVVLDATALELRVLGTGSSAPSFSPRRTICLPNNLTTETVKCLSAFCSGCDIHHKTVYLLEDGPGMEYGNETREKREEK